MTRLHEIPTSARWALASHVLTRLVLELGRTGGGQPGESPDRKRLFSILGKEARRIADGNSMKRDNAADLVATLGAVSVILFGRAFETRYIEGFPEEGVIRLAECAMFREESAPGIPPAEVHAVCSAYVRAVVEALNPEFSVGVSMARCRGDGFCEMVIARKEKLWD
ncbi:MAG: hypothetical protein QHH04_06305 [Methanolinea sp.]|nr:hypothetical protein [Methanolinea sp.]